MDYSSHPLLEGFKDHPDEKLLEVAIAQIDMAAWIKQGAKFGKAGISEEVKTAITDGLKGVPRADLEKFLYHAIVAAVEANQESRERGKNHSVSNPTG